MMELCMSLFCTVQYSSSGGSGEGGEGRKEGGEGIVN